jgi:hypothetical protein
MRREALPPCMLPANRLVSAWAKGVCREARKMGRIGSTAAFAGLCVLTGTGVAGAADPVPQAVVTMHQRAVDDGECQALDGMLMYYKPTIAALSPTDTLYILPCDFGILDPPSRLYIQSTGAHPGVRVLMFAQYDRDFGWIGDDEQFNAAFDPKTMTLTAREYFDPAGDCGSDGTWVWRDYAFQLQSYRYQGACDHTKGVKDWPTVWTFPSSADAAPRPQIGTVPDFFQGTP